MGTKKRKKEHVSPPACPVRKPCPATGTGRVGKLVCYRCRIERLAELISRAQPLLKCESARIKDAVARLKLPDDKRVSAMEQLHLARMKDKAVYRTLKEFNEASEALLDKILSDQERSFANRTSIPAAAALSSIPSKVLKELSIAADDLFKYHHNMSRWVWLEFKKCAGCGETIRAGKYCVGCRREGIPAARDMANFRVRTALKAKQKDNKERAEKQRHK